jgi:hypothetical protein
VHGLHLTDPNLEIELPPSPHIRSESDRLRGVCKTIQEEGHPLQNYDDLEARIDRFIRLHEKARDAQQEIDANNLIEAEIDEEKPESLVDSVRSEWESNKLESLVEPHITVENVQDGEIELEDFQHLSWKGYPRKESFLQDRGPSAVEGFGQEIGQWLWRRERNALFRALSDALPAERIHLEDLGDRIEEALDNLEGKGYTPSILFGGSSKIWMELQRYDDRFTPYWKEPDEMRATGYKGGFEETPLYGSAANTSAVLLVDLEAAVSIRRFVPEEDEALCISVDPISKTKAQEMVADEPELRIRLASDEDKLSEEDTIRELRQHVIVAGEEYIQFEIGDCSAGVVFDVTDIEQKEET